MRISLVPAIGALLLLLNLFDSAEADNILISDGFDSGNTYSIFSFNDADLGGNPDDLSTADFVTIASGGNPGHRLELTHEHDVQRDEFGDPLGDPFTSVQSFVENQTVAYNPFISGAFDTVTFSIDYRTNDPILDVFFGVSDSSGGSFAGFSVINTDGNWNTLSLTFNQADFASRDFAGNDDLRFGFGFFSPGIDTSFGPEFLAVDVDNFQVSVASVPEPSGLPLGLVMLALMRNRRRSRDQ